MFAVTKYWFLLTVYTNVSLLPRVNMKGLKTNHLTKYSYFKPATRAAWGDVSGTF